MAHYDQPWEGSGFYRATGSRRLKTKTSPKTKVGSHGNVPLSEASGSAQSEAKESTSSHSVSPSPVEQAKEKVLNAADKLTSIWDVTKANGWTQIVEAIDELIAAVSADAHQEIERMKADAVNMTRTINQNATAAVIIAEDRAKIAEQLAAAEARLSALQVMEKKEDKAFTRSDQPQPGSCDADPRDDLTPSSIQEMK